MPNHITNIVEFTDISDERIKEILEAIKNDEKGIGSLDFNKVIPTPPDIYQGNLGQAEEMKYGEKTWYHFNLSQWGTKWNSYDPKPYNNGENKIQFLTAWSAPHPVIQKLSEMCPDATINHAWADEDLGYNTGRRKYKNGEIVDEYIPECPSKESYDFAAEVMNIDLAEEGYQLSEDGTHYEYIED